MNGNHGWAAEHDAHGHDARGVRADQRPRAGGNAVDAVHEEHRDQRPELAQDVDGLLGIERHNRFRPLMLPEIIASFPNNS